MEPVGHLYEHDAYILAHCQQKFTEILCLERRLVTEYTTRNLGKAFDELGYLLAEVLLNVLDCIFSILDYVVEQSRADRSRAEADLLTGDLGHGDRVKYIRLARTPAYALVCLLGKMIGTLDYLDFLAVVAFEIAVENFAERFFYHSILLFWGHSRFRFHFSTD